MVTFNGWYADGGGGGKGLENLISWSIGVYTGRYGRTPVPTFSNIHAKIRKVGSQEPSSVFYSPHRKGQPSHSVVALALEYLVGTHSMATLSERGKHPKDVSILSAVIRSARCRLRCKE